MGDNLNLNSERLSELDNDINKAREALADAGEVLANEEHNLTIKREKTIFKAKYDEKLSDITAKSKATIECEQELKAYMLADAKYKRAKIRVDFLVDSKQTLMEQNYNIRAQMKVFGN